jgi:transcriptional regulator with XRE-family HTH domain
MSPWPTVDDRGSAHALGMVIIGDGIRSGRLRLRMTQRQLAWRVGLSQSAISRLATGTSQGLRLRTLARIVAELESGSEYVFPGGPPHARRHLPGQSID